MTKKGMTSYAEWADMIYVALRENGELTTGHMTDITGCPRGSVHQALNILVDAGLVACTTPTRTRWKKWAIVEDFGVQPTKNEQSRTEALALDILDRMEILCEELKKQRVVQNKLDDIRQLLGGG